MVIFDIPPSVDAFNPECRPADFALKPGIASFKDGKPVSRKTYWGLSTLDRLLLVLFDKKIFDFILNSPGRLFWLEMDSRKNVSVFSAYTLHELG